MLQKLNKTKSRKWADLTLVEFKGIYPAIELNAERHFRCAEILAQASEHQNAIAHLILGTEELIKAFGCLLMERKVKLKNQSWFGKLFSDHKTRHDLIKDFFSIYLLLTFSLKNGGKINGLWSFLSVALENTAFAAGNYLWWENADGLKQRTFYVDYVDKIIDPASIEIKDYNVARTYVLRFRKDMIKFMREIEQTPESFLRKFFEDFDLDELDKLRQEAYSKKKIKK